MQTRSVDEGVRSHISLPPHEDLTNNLFNFRRRSRLPYSTPATPVHILINSTIDSVYLLYEWLCPGRRSRIKRIGS